MALAPALIASRIVSSVGPPVAMIGTSGKFFADAAHDIGCIFPAADVQDIDTGIKPCLDIHVFRHDGAHDRNIHGFLQFVLIVSIGVGALTTDSQGSLRFGKQGDIGAALSLRSFPPPTPERIGMVETLAILWMTAGCGVNG